ncbi:twin-arginine translocation pathway signal [Colletotrichum chrysophilum]|uniref:Twin-arginine translocation pathway signal n=1 Tax=Colletotrichum chrysophilum TaxID=1836956 RepID=A0AAD8ZZ59_9PEZI|nr:twin-arginine translocation pathway signal [Colletotrichum chrysophilum]
MRCHSLAKLLALPGLAWAASHCNTTQHRQSQLTISAPAARSLQLALFIKNAEVDFFRRLSSTVETTSPPNITGADLESISTQDQIQRDALRRILDAAGEDPVQPCTYSPPPGDWAASVSAGSRLKSIGASANLGIAESIAATDATLLPGVLAMAATEARHDAVMAAADGKPASPTAFDTAIPEEWAFNLALGSVVPGTCPSLPALPVVPGLLAQLGGVGGGGGSGGSGGGGGVTCSFSWDPEQAAASIESPKPLFIAWVNQLAAPVYTSLAATSPGNGTASPPGGMAGSVFAVLTSQDEAATVAELAGYTLAGPAYLSV